MLEMLEMLILLEMLEMLESKTAKICLMFMFSLVLWYHFLFWNK